MESYKVKTLGTINAIANSLKWKRNISTFMVPLDRTIWPSPSESEASGFHAVLAMCGTLWSRKNALTYMDAADTLMSNVCGCSWPLTDNRDLSMWSNLTNHCSFLWLSQCIWVLICDNTIRISHISVALFPTVSCNVYVCKIWICKHIFGSLTYIKFTEIWKISNTTVLLYISGLEYKNVFLISYLHRCALCCSNLYCAKSPNIGHIWCMWKILYYICNCFRTLNTWKIKVQRRAWRRWYKSFSKILMAHLWMNWANSLLVIFSPVSVW